MQIDGASYRRAHQSESVLPLPRFLAWDRASFTSDLSATFSIFGSYLATFVLSLRREQQTVAGNFCKLALSIGIWEQNVFHETLAAANPLSKPAARSVCGLFTEHCRLWVFSVQPVIVKTDPSKCLHHLRPLTTESFVYSHAMGFIISVRAPDRKKERRLIIFRGMNASTEKRFYPFTRLCDSFLRLVAVFFVGLQVHFSWLRFDVLNFKLELFVRIIKHVAHCENVFGI